MKRNKLLTDRNGELASGLLGVLGIDGAGGRCWVCNGKSFL